MKPPVHRPQYMRDAPRRKPTTKRLLGRAFQRRRERLLMQSPLCVECEREGIVAVGVELDHIVPLADGGADHESNLQSLCRAHHVQKTARENRARMRSRRDRRAS